MSERAVPCVVRGITYGLGMPHGRAKHSVYMQVYQDFIRLIILSVNEITFHYFTFYTGCKNNKM